MQTATFLYDGPGGWSGTPSPDLDSERTLVTVFGASSFQDEPEPFDDLVRAFPRSVLVGCSTAGAWADGGIEDTILAVSVTRFEHGLVRKASAPSADSLGAGRILARALAGDGLRAVLVLADGLSTNGSALTRGLSEGLPRDVVVMGALAADGIRFRRTWVASGSTVGPGQACAVGFYGAALAVGIGARGGWQPTGPERVITRSDGNLLRDLDHKPALTTFRHYLGALAGQMPASALHFPLNLLVRGGDPQGVVRTVVGVDEETQGLIFAGDMPEGARVRLMRADSAGLVGGARAAAHLACPGSFPHGPLALVFSGVGRRLLLKEGAVQELAAIHEHLPRGSSLAGGYTYGELASMGGRSADLHNQVLTVTLLGER